MSRPTFGTLIGGRRGAPASRAAAPAASAPITRREITDRLGLPVTATDRELLAAVDEAVARKRARTAADALYDSIYTK